MTNTPSFGCVVALESLREHLQWAIELEHFNLPPYLCALYTLDPVRNPQAVEIVRGVVIEEMLHMNLAANLLNAVGGRPRLDSRRLLRGYPACLPRGDRSFQVPLLRFGLEALEVFSKIERPALISAPAERECYETIGQFYAAIEAALREFSDNFGDAELFCGDPSRQVTSARLNGFDGGLRPIIDLTSALDALEKIVDQGEGAGRLQVWDGDHQVFHPDRDEVAHYYRFEELKLGRCYRRGDTPQSGPTGDPIVIDWDGVRAMRPNPSMSDHEPGSPIFIAQHEFNLAYCTLLQSLERTFDGHPQLFPSAMGAMYDVRSKAEALLSMPIEHGDETAGPAFEYVIPELRAARATHADVRAESGRSEHRDSATGK